MMKVIEVLEDNEILRYFSSNLLTEVLRKSATPQKEQRYFLKY